MSRAFTRNDADDAPLLVPPRAPLPEGVSNYVTKRGLALLRDELAHLESERAAAAKVPEGAERRRALSSAAARISQLEERITGAVLIGTAGQDPDRVRFGARVTVIGADGSERSHRIVGVDESDPGRGLVAFTSPVARALLGRIVGDAVTVSTPRGGEELEILRVDYDDE